ncbi:MAG: S-layer homology domain-containing protein [Candidatus Gracilibacteria bacterium]|nr:S-layer homology domain-containing protein [Candidatus Gracilibacteria bacterium]
MKKIIIFVMSFALLLSNSLVAIAVFEDVKLEHKNSQAISFLQDSDVISGYLDGSFKPDGKLNRAQLMKILVEGQGITPDPEQYKNCFPDVADQWYAPYVCYGKEVGWVEGFSDGNFRPESTVNKSQAIKMTIESQGFEVSGEACDRALFKDVSDSVWYGKYVCLGLKKGLLEEDENGNYLPTGEITRAQVSENIFRSIVLRKLNREAYTQEVKGLAVEALVAFKEEKNAIKLEIDGFKEELKKMREDGATDTEIKTLREEFWGTVNASHQANREEFQAKIKAAHELFNAEKTVVKTKLQECNAQGMKYSFMESKCVEKNAIGGAAKKAAVNKPVDTTGGVNAN